MRTIATIKYKDAEPIVTEFELADDVHPRPGAKLMIGDRCYRIESVCIEGNVIDGVRMQIEMQHVPTVVDFWQLLWPMLLVAAVLLAAGVAYLYLGG